MQFFASVNLLIAFDSVWDSKHSQCNQTQDPSFSITYSFTNTHILVYAFKYFMAI